MRFSRILWAFGLFVGLILGVFAYLGSLKAELPAISVENVTPQTLAQSEQSLPLFELMVPIPTPAGYFLLPKLEYVKGPPERYLERIQFLMVPEKNGPKERIIFYGRRTQELGWFPWLADKSGVELAQVYRAAFLYALGKETKFVDKLSGLNRLMTHYIFSHDGAEYLRGVERLTIMDQAGTPAFLFTFKSEGGEPQRARIWFFRRNSLYQVEFRADTRFTALRPEEFFRKSFLSENRSSALGYVASALSKIRFDGHDSEHLSPQALSWPLALLGAHLSLDPASVDTYFHFAGLCALLYKSPSVDTTDIETLDVLRNNVLASELFAKDVAPQSEKTGAMGELARSLLHTEQ